MVFGIFIVVQNSKILKCIKINIQIIYFFHFNFIIFSSLLALFWLKMVEVNGNERFVSQKAAKDLKFIETLVNEKITDPKEKSDLYKKLWTTPSGKKSFDEAIQVLKEEYTFSLVQTGWTMTGASIGS